MSIDSRIDHRKRIRQFLRPSIGETYRKENAKKILPRLTSPTLHDKIQRSICGHGGIGRLGGFRFHCDSVQVRVLLPAPNQYDPNLVFPAGDGFGLFVFFDKFEETPFRNGVSKQVNCYFHDNMYPLHVWFPELEALTGSDAPPCAARGRIQSDDVSAFCHDIRKAITTRLFNRHSHSY